ncbi:MAG: response regulator, partial [Psychrosphaera sp.]|nr:response regulator [Psychrosphaera sp.]
RYDGDSVKRFAHQVDDADSLTDNWVVDMVADNQGYLWIISRGQGLSRFDTVQETFVHFSHVLGDSTTLDSNELNFVALTPDNQLWIGSKRGLNLFNTQTLTNQRFDPGMRFGNERRALAGAIRPSYWATSTAYVFYALVGSLSLLFYYLIRVRVYSHIRTIEGQGKDKASTPQKPSLKKATIMIVVDKGEMREQLVACLDDTFVCNMTDNTAYIIAQTRELRPDLVICDVMIEQISGSEITIMLKRNPDTCSVPTLLLTDSTSQNHRLNRSQPRVDACIENPFSAAKLILRIDQLLSNRNLLARRHQKIITQPINTNTNTIFESSSAEGQSVGLAVIEKMKAGQLKRKFSLLLDKVLEKNYSDCHFDVTRF